MCEYVCGESNDNRRHHWLIQRCMVVFFCFLFFVLICHEIPKCRIFSSIVHAVWGAVFLSVLWRWPGEYTHVCARIHTDDVYTFTHRVMCNIKYILKKQFWAPLVDSASALLGGNVQSGGNNDCLSYNPWELVSLPQERQPVPQCPQFIDTVRTVF